MRPLLRLTVSGLLMLALPVVSAAVAAEPTGRVLCDLRFHETEYGHVPQGWRDLTRIRPSRNWMVDDHGALRQVIKNHTGLIVLDGAAASSESLQTLTDVRLVSTFTKTEDDRVSFGLAGRVLDRGNYYLARFSGTQHLELLLVRDGVETPLDVVPLPDLKVTRPTGRITRRRCRAGEPWTLSLLMQNDHIEATVFDPDGVEQARISVINEEFRQGASGLCCTRFAAAMSFRIESLRPVDSPADTPQTAERDITTLATEPRYSVVRPLWQTNEVDTPRARIGPDYDVVIAGAGTGGWAAAVQAARLGARVLLLEETDWIGGQMAAAGVTTMDEDGGWMKFPVRERGIYREFHESMVLYYQSLNKDPFVTYFSWPDQLEGGYEPKAARAVLYAFIRQVRERGQTLDLSLRTRVTAVTRAGDTVTGATLTFADGAHQDVACRILMDATEYGDVMPLTGARYRVGNSTSDQPDPTALVQDHTWTCVVREYPGGVPEHLQIREPPPGYETGSGKRYRKYTNDGVVIWGAAGKGFKASRHWSVFFAWRGMADADSPLIGESSLLRHTQCGFNGGNDYPVTAATIENTEQRLKDEREGIYKTLGALYYFQKELGVNWSLAEDEGYATEANRAKMKALNLRPDLEAMAIHLPQHPYVRECRRIIGVQTLTARDLGRYENAKHVTTSVAMGDYFMDLDHGKTAHAVEPDLDSGDLPRGGGPFQIPFEVFIPERIDGFIPAEKNLSQSRLANGATRLQPVTMLTGQAAGTIAALAARHHIPPRALKPLQVQVALLDSGCTLIQRWYADIPWGTELWRATQLLALYQILDRPGPLDQDSNVTLASRAAWGATLPLSDSDRRHAIERVRALTNHTPVIPDETRLAGDFAIAIARSFVKANQP